MRGKRRESACDMTDGIIYIAKYRDLVKRYVQIYEIMKLAKKYLHIQLSCSTIILGLCCKGAPNTDV